MLKLLISRCARCSKTGAHSDHFLLHINNRGRFRFSDPAAQQLPAARGEPCARMLGHGMAPSAVSVGNSQHAEAIPICHPRDVNNVLDRTASRCETNE